VCGEASILKQRRKRVHVPLLIAVCVALGIGRARGDGPGIVVSDVGDEAADRGGGASALVNISVEGSGLLEVLGPAEPASVASVEVHDDILEVERLYSVLGESLVRISRVGAFGHVHVGNHIGQAIGF